MSFLGRVSRLLPWARLPTVVLPSWDNLPRTPQQWSHTCHPVVLRPLETVTWHPCGPSCICPGASRRAYAVGLVGGCPEAPWEAPWAPEKLFGLGRWRHCLIKADEKRPFCFIKKIKKLRMRGKNQHRSERKKREKKQMTQQPAGFLEPNVAEKAPEWIRRRENIANFCY